MPHQDSLRPIRRKCRAVMVGGFRLGGGAPVSIQSMTNARTSDVEATVAQILALRDAGCDLVRVAVPDMAAAEAISSIKARIGGIPLVADIHFDWRLAIACMRGGVDKVRLNPGNIGGMERVREVVAVAREMHVPIRVGVNAGSLEKELLERYGGVCPEALVESALSHVRMLEALDFGEIVISVKSSNVPLSLATHRLLARETDYPLHIGITEAGTVYRGTVKSAVGIGALLLDGIGDTIRVSLTGDPVEEVRAAKEILRSCGLYGKGIEFISCPTCGRTEINLIAIAEKVEQALEGIDVPLKVAIMGCGVNGPGEARDADIGIAGGNGGALLFRKGEIIRRIPEEAIVGELVAEVRMMALSLISDSKG
jgi:(E)-4-hydroxy-3-methylbut-2-enyl-diphosphate synthase